MTRPSGVPAEAEQHSALDYFRAYDFPSRLLPNVNQRVWRLHCPGCSATQPQPYEISRCACGLSMMIDAATLYVWTEKETADVQS